MDYPAVIAFFDDYNAHYRSFLKFEYSKMNMLNKGEIEKLRGDLQTLPDDGWKNRYETLMTDFEGYKAEQQKKETRAAKEAAYRALLKTAGVSEKRIDAVLRVTDLEPLELQDGELQDAERLLEEIEDEWADFIGTVGVKGAATVMPPKVIGRTSGDLGRLSMKDYITARKKKG